MYARLNKWDTDYNTTRQWHKVYKTKLISAVYSGIKLYWVRLSGRSKVSYSSLVHTRGFQMLTNFKHIGQNWHKRLNKFFYILFIRIHTPEKSLKMQDHTIGIYTNNFIMDYLGKYCT